MQTGRLAMGTVQFGLDYGISNKAGQVSLVDAKEMLDIAAEHGLNTIDTAIAYGNSELVLGSIGVDQQQVITKLPPLAADCENVAAWVEQSMQNSLANLRLQQVYGLLLHHSTDLLGSRGYELYQALSNLKKSGYVKKIGVSIYSPKELDALEPKFKLDLIQAPFNLIDQRLYQSDWLDKLKNQGVEVHTRSAFLQGLLLMPRNQVPAKFSPWDALIKQWHDWLDANKISALSATLRFALSFNQIDKVVVGAENTQQLLEIMQAAGNSTMIDFPEISSIDEQLINPGSWSNL
jgi:aryl-alcohol dehydrogenase-like predicted oxidoreductase